MSEYMTKSEVEDRKGEKSEIGKGRGEAGKGGEEKRGEEGGEGMAATFWSSLRPCYL